MLSIYSADPTSSNYSKHWSRVKIREVFQPDQAAVESVKSWLSDFTTSSGDVQESLYQGKITFTTTAEKAAIMFQTTFSHYYNAKSDTQAVGCEQYSLLSYMVQHIDFVTPIIGLDSLVKQTKTRRHPSKPLSHYSRSAIASRSMPMIFANCYEAAFPECIATLYNIPPFTGNPNPNNEMEIFNEHDAGQNESYS